MKWTKKGLLLSLTMGLAVMAAVACGSDDSETPSTGGSTSGTAAPGQAASTAAPTTSAPASSTGSYTPAPAAQQVFVIGLAGQPVFLDPHKSQFSQDIAVERQLWRPLFWQSEKGEPVAAVAKELPTTANGGLSADGKTVKVTLKDNQKWSDGSALTARDFEYSFKRAVHPKLASPYAGELFNIVGAEEFYTSKSTDAAELNRLRDAIGVKATDEKTLTITLKNAEPTITSKWGLWITYPVKQSAVEANGAPIENTAWATTPGRNIGNGPFVLKEYKEKDRIILERNENYTAGDKPKLTRLDIRPYEDEEVAFNAFQTGEFMYSAVPTSKIPLVDGDANLKKQNIRGADPTVFWLQFQHETPALKNKMVRTAMAKALDRDAFVKAVLGGVGEPTTLFMHTSDPGQNRTDGDSLKYDVAAAKKMLADAGFPNGQGFPELSLITSQAAVSKASAEFVQNQLKTNLGINIKLEVLDSQTRSSRYSNSQFELAIGGWHEDFHDPENWLPTLMKTGATNNQLKYSNPTFDALVSQAQFELNTEKRLGLYAQANKVLLEDAAVAPIYQRIRNAVVSAKVKNLTPHPQDSGWAGNMFMEKVEISTN